MLLESTADFPTGTENMLPKREPPTSTRKLRRPLTRELKRSEESITDSTTETIHFGEEITTKTTELGNSGWEKKGSGIDGTASSGKDSITPEAGSTRLSTRRDSTDTKIWLRKLLVRSRPPPRNARLKPQRSSPSRLKNILPENGDFGTQE